MVQFPKEGLSESEIVRRLQQYQKRSSLYRHGKNWGMGFYPYPMATKAWEMFVDSNMIYAALGAGNPFPGITDMEAEAVSMMGSVFGYEKAVGNITIGGTESNVIAMKVARDYALGEKRRKTMSVVMPTTAHPSIIKGCHLVGLDAIRVPVDKEYKADPKKMEQAVKDDTVAIVASCGQHMHGTIDPIEAIGKIAKKHDLYYHIDAAWGGLICCWLRKAGLYDIPPFDFSVPQVTSMTVDPHKQGFAPMPAGGILYRDEKLHKMQAFDFDDDMHGHYFSWTLQGSRTGAPIAATWAMFQHLGEEGYINLSKKCMDLTYKLVKGIRQIPGMKVPVEPKMNIFAAETVDYNVHDVVAELEKKGWTALYINKVPPSFRCVVLPHHENQIDPFLDDLEAATKAAKTSKR